MGKLFIQGALNGSDIKIKKFLSDFSKESLCNSKSWEGKIWDFFSNEAFVFLLREFLRSFNRG